MLTATELFDDDLRQTALSPAEVLRTLRTTLTEYRYSFSDEAALQAALAGHLIDEGYRAEREVVLDAANRADIVVDGQYVIEVKIAGSASEVARQVERYSNFDSVTGILIVTTVSGHMAVPGRTPNGKPVEVLFLSSTNGLVVPAATKLTDSVGTIRRDGDEWVIVCQPHLMIRLKRIFQRIHLSQTGEARVQATQEVARDLTDMVLSRWPTIEMSDEDRALIEQEAQAHRERGETILSILGGDYPTTGDMRVPARPARWDHQTRNAELISLVKGLLIGDKLGRGKTYSSLMALRNPDSLPAVVVVPTHIPAQWQREIEATWPDLTVHIASKARAYPLDEQPDVLIVPYSKIAGWGEAIAGNANTVIFDEVQHLRNGPQKTTRGAACQVIASNARYRVGLSGTPVHNYGGDMHHVMGFLRPDLLGTRAEFLREWCGGGGGDSKPRVTNPDALAAFLLAEGAMVAAEGDATDPATRIEHVVESDPKVFERLVANAVALAESMLSATATREERFTSKGQFEMWMRQATGIAKAPYVATFVEMLLEAQEKVLLVGYHREVYRIWNERLSRFGVAMYTGSENQRQKAESFDRFVNGKARIMMMSLASGEGLDGLQQACNVVVFGELDWSPAVPTQIIGRLDRPGQTEPVVAYFLTSDEGADPHMLNTLGVKDRQAAPFNGGSARDLTGLAVDKDDLIRQMAREVIERAAAR